MALLGAPIGYTVFSLLSLPLFLIGALLASTIGGGGGIESFYSAVEPYSWRIGGVCGGGWGLVAGFRDLKSEYVVLERWLSRSRLEVSLEVQHPEDELKAELPEVERVMNVERIVPSVGDKIRIGQHIQFSSEEGGRSEKSEEWLWDCVVSDVRYDVQPFHDAVDVRVVVHPADYSEDLLN